MPITVGYQLELYLLFNRQGDEFGQLLNGGDSVAEVPLPIVPTTICYVTEKSTSIGSTFSRRLFF
jgi:hypothetical protein